jgi:hypothetical protein
MIANYSKGIDAISWYSVGATEKDMPFEKLKDDCEDLMVKIGKFCKGNNIDIIPAFTAGRDTRARIRTGVFWCAGDPNATEDKDKPYGNKYALPPTNEELAKHINRRILVLALARCRKLVCVKHYVGFVGLIKYAVTRILTPPEIIIQL